MSCIVPAMDRGQERPGVEELEGRVSELERLADALENAPGDEVAAILDRALALLEEVGAGIEAHLVSLESGEREVGKVLGEADLGPLDAALRELERPADEHG
jgi:hypothetical protein